MKRISSQLEVSVDEDELRRVVEKHAWHNIPEASKGEGKLWRRGGVSFGEVVAIDRIARTIDVKKGRTQAEEHPSAVFEHTHISTRVLEDTIGSVGGAMASAPGCDGGK